MNLKVLFYLSSSQNEYNTKGKEKNDIKWGEDTQDYHRNADDIQNTRYTEKLCNYRISEIIIRGSLDTRIPVDREIRREGI